MFLNRSRQSFSVKCRILLDRKLISVGVFLLAFCASSHAEHFGIQLGAYKNLNDAVLKKAEVLGEVSTVKSGNLTRVVVGSYIAYSDAASELLRIHSAGFTDAFVIQISDADTRPQQSHSHDGKPHAHLSKRVQSKLDKLTAEQREKVVILDGELHLKEGGVFTPL